MMTLVEQHRIKKSDPLFWKLDHLCYLSKNLYNATLYMIRHHFFNTKEYLSYASVNRQMIIERNPDYYALNTKVSQQTQKLVDKSFKSYFALHKKYSCGKIANRPHIPKYLDKNGRQVVMFTNQAISTKRVGFVKLGGTDIYVPTKQKSIQFVRLVPHGSSVTVEIGYFHESIPYVDNNRYAAIDLGVDNLATLTFTDDKPIIFNGKPVKSINQYYNKRLTTLRSKQDLSPQPHRNTKRIDALTSKRFCKIKDYMHKISHEIVNQLVSHNVTNLVIGYNKGWKQDANMGSVNNQKFVQIPFLMLLNMLMYKCELVGIRCETIQESHTSKCSFLDKEDICHHDKYVGRRVHRGLFRSSNGQTINADVNGSLNIMRRYLNVVKNTDIYDIVNLIEVCSTPSVFTVKL